MKKIYKRVFPVSFRLFIWRMIHDIGFYMSIEGHIGFPEWLSRLSFEYFLYEGHEGESIKGVTNKINVSKLKIKILENLKSRVGDSLARPILLFRRV